MNTRALSAVGMVASLLLACGQGPQPATGTVIQADADAVADSSVADTAADAVPSPDAPDETGPLADVPGDVPGDVPADDLAAGEVQGADADADAGCQPANCTLDCAKGFKKDDQGCEICACATCQADVDCALLSCSNAICGAKGECVCGGCNDKAPKFYTCPGGLSVPWCACTKTGYACISQPELQCPTLCHAGQGVPYPCAMGDLSWCACKPSACVPYCAQIGTPEEGWADGCTGAVLKKQKCSDATVACTAIGSKSEGWSSSTTGLIGWTSCAPKWQCGGAPQQACADKECPAIPMSWPCPGGEKPPMCTCTPKGDGACPPSCENMGTAEEGWYDSCSKKLLKKEKCQGCTYDCGAIGSKSEGWYSSCSGLIGWANCASASWSCDPQPWLTCKQPLECTTEGKTWNKTGGTPGLCCPGLKAVKALIGDGKSCAAPKCDCWTCTACGDAQCGLGENPCNCPSDCTPAAGLKGQGQPCQAEAECAQPLTCLGAIGGSTGICTRLCKPGPLDDCGKGFICLSNPMSAAPGSCMKACATSAECAGPLTCAAFSFSATPPAAGGCFGWPACDPVGNTLCAPGQQCFLVEGKSACATPGKLGKGAACDPKAMQCGPSLVCGTLKQCAPACSQDDNCKALGYDFCLKKPTEATWGHCMHYVK